MLGFLSESLPLRDGRVVWILVSQRALGRDDEARLTFLRDDLKLDSTGPPESMFACAVEVGHTTEGRPALTQLMLTSRNFRFQQH
jgi:hypothetical protein